MCPLRARTTETEQDGEYVRSPTRQVRPAYSRQRRIWYGVGQLGRDEKNGYGQFLHDASSTFIDVSLFGLPMLVYVMRAAPTADVDIVAPAMVAWATMVVVATLLRGGWVAPLGSRTLGWVALRPSLFVLRAGYYNLGLGVAVVGSSLLVASTGLPGVGVGSAFVVSAVTTWAFPTVADAFFERVVT